jgi:hypothetical protein
MSGHDAIIEDDCPLCQLQAEMPGPMFWHLDGCNMDDDFAFAFSHDSFEDWKQDRLAWDEFNRRFDAVWSEKMRLEVEYPDGGYEDPDLAWERSFRPTDDAWEKILAVRLFAIGSGLSELIVDLRELRQEPSTDGCEPSDSKARPPSSPDPVQAAKTQPGEEGARIDHLTRVFHGLRKWVASDLEQAWGSLPPLLADFQQTLEIVAAARPDVSRQCVELRGRLRRFLEPPSESDETALPETDVFPT